MITNFNNIIDSWSSLSAVPSYLASQQCNQYVKLINSNIVEENSPPPTIHGLTDRHHNFNRGHNSIYIFPLLQWETNKNMVETCFYNGIYHRKIVFLPYICLFPIVKRKNAD